MRITTRSIASRTAGAHLVPSGTLHSKKPDLSEDKSGFFAGAADRTRTGTELPPADFKSAVSTIPPQRRGLPNHFSTVFRGSQGSLEGGNITLW